MFEKIVKLEKEFRIIKFIHFELESLLKLISQNYITKNISNQSTLFLIFCNL